MRKKGIPSAKMGLDHYRHPDEFGNWLGYKVLKLDRKKMRATTELLIRRDHLSPAGRVHGGVVSACFDAAMGIAVFTTLGPRDFTATVELKVNYLLPLALGDRVKLEVGVVFRGRRLAVTHGFLYANGARQPAAMATGTFTIIAEAHAPARAIARR